MAKLHLRNDPVLMSLKIAGERCFRRVLHKSGKLTIRAGNGYKATRIKPGLTPRDIQRIWLSSDLDRIVHIEPGVNMDLPVIIEVP